MGRVEVGVAAVLCNRARRGQLSGVGRGGKCEQGWRWVKLILI